MKFKIVNRTRFQSRHLRKFVTRAWRIATAAAGPTRTANHAATVTRITITFARSNRWHRQATGHAYYHGRKAHVGIPDTPDRRDLALTIAHEFGHNLGLRHPDMNGGPLWRNDCPEQNARLYGWADTLPLEIRTPRNRLHHNPATVYKPRHDWQSVARQGETQARTVRPAE